MDAVHVTHVAAVLPVVGRSRRLPAAALVIGSMAPDYPWFLTRGHTAGLCHSLLGIVTVDLAVGLLAVVLWWRWAQAPVRDLVPRAVGERLPLPRGLAARELPWAALAVVLGALTHVVWDSFTHAGRWGVELVPRLQTEHLGLPGYAWARYASGLLGLLALLHWGRRQLAATVPDGTGLRSTSADRRTAWGLVAAGAVVGVGVGLLSSAGSAQGRPVPCGHVRGCVAGGGRRAGVWALVGPGVAPGEGRGPPRVACRAWHAASRRTPRSTSRPCSSSPGPGTTWCSSRRARTVGRRPRR